MRCALQTLGLFTTLLISPAALPDLSRSPSDTQFASTPRPVLRRIASFLGLGPFPRLVQNYKWTWNVNSHGGRRRPRQLSEQTLIYLRKFFAPYTDALTELLKKRGQPVAAHFIDRWPRR